jgi:hypothetical protein
MVAQRSHQTSCTDETGELASLYDDPEELASEIRRTLQISLTEQAGWRDPRIAFNTWRSRVEGLGGPRFPDNPRRDLHSTIRSSTVGHLRLPVGSGFGTRNCHPPCERTGTTRSRHQSPQHFRIRKRSPSPMLTPVSRRYAHHSVGSWLESLPRRAGAHLSV